MDRFETARQARRQIIAGLRQAGVAEEEVAAHEAREAAYDRQIGIAEDSES